jgi:hypothetical protein
MAGQWLAGPSYEPGWSRRKLIVLTAVALLFAVLMLIGLGLALRDSLGLRRPTPKPTTSTTAAGSVPAASIDRGGHPAIDERDELAAAPMPTFGLSAAQPGPVSTRDPGPSLLLPRSSTVGLAGVSTGYSHTPEGALAQLAAIDQRALQSGALAGARDVIVGWALPGGPTSSSWSGVAALAQLLTGAGLAGDGSPELTVVVTPLMGLIKGSVGPDFVVPCVDFEIDATLTQTARVAVADCQRMVWHEGRWMIGPGPEPADPPSVWPDTDLALSVGYRDLRHG